MEANLDRLQDMTLHYHLLVQLVKQYPDMEFIGVDYDKIEERNKILCIESKIQD